MSYLTLAELNAGIPQVNDPGEERVQQRMNALNRKLVVLDDDPTGTQTVHGVSVYTDWSEESIRSGFLENRPMFFLLTNSRGLSREDTIRVHRQIGERVARVAAQTGRDFLLLSRSDSTLRGYYPLETEVLRQSLERSGADTVDGEILCPFFPQGGRFTAGNVHYVLTDGHLIPAGETEFARDATFGYRNSDLTRWVEEKTEGLFPAEEQTAITLEELRAGDIGAVTRRLTAVSGFRKVIVNAVDVADLRMFALALADALDSGKRFLFRTAAALTQVLGGISERPLLSRNELVDAGNSNGGLFLVGSHVKKTTEQLEALLTLEELVPVEFRSSLVTEPAAFHRECARVQDETELLLRQGKTPVIFTERTLLLPPDGTPQSALRLSLDISEAMTGFVKHLQVRPRFIVAKGGITSSEIGVHGLSVRRAEVQGQAQPGVPVWKLGPESRFPGLSYLIFPGNVGSKDSLYRLAVLLLNG